MKKEWNVKLKNVIKKIENKILKLLHKKIEISTVLSIIVLEGMLFLFLHYNRVSYRYIDTNNNVGVSKNCYYNDIYREIQCDIPTKVNQYEKRK